eukprot:scaffold102918_cov67-Phaeocystis_antarctica.AAC.3
MALTRGSAAAQYQAIIPPRLMPVAPTREQSTSGLASSQSITRMRSQTVSQMNGCRCPAAVAVSPAAGALAARHAAVSAAQ